MHPKPHLVAAHAFWQGYLTPADHVIDATCGAGRDTAVLAQLVPEGHVYALDIQEEALARARHNAPFPNITFLQRCHTQLPKSEKIRLVVYNLGYLPGGDKSLTTLTATTVASLEAAYALLTPGGALSVTCYPGHPEGAREEEAIRAWALHFEVTWLEWKKGSPTVLIVYKKL